MRVKFNPLALLLDSSLEGEYDLVQRVIYDVSRTSLTQLSCFYKRMKFDIYYIHILELLSNVTCKFAIICSFGFLVLHYNRD